jgi:hypothetical protein
MIIIVLYEIVKNKKWMKINIIGKNLVDGTNNRK